jgi:AcrR family transcriptional regulator
MATYVKGTETKRQLVALTYRMLLEKDASQITVRDVAREQGLSPAAIYRHFSSIDYLVIVASVRFISEYMDEYAKLLDRDEPFLKSYVDGWELFNRYAFKRPDIYYRLFWGRYNPDFSRAVEEYLDLFPIEGSTKHVELYKTLIKNPSMFDRDYIYLQQGVDSGVITDEDARYLSYISPIIVHALVDDAIEMDEKSRARAEQLCNSLIRENLDRRLS